MHGNHPKPNPPTPPPPPRGGDASAPDSATTVWSANSQLTALVLVILLIGLAGYHLFGPSRQPRPLDSVSTSAKIQTTIDINRASRSELLQLPGAGPALVEQLLSHRQINGPFRKIEDLDAVPGVGPAVLKRLAPYLAFSTVEDEPSDPETTAIKLERKSSENAAPMIVLAKKPTLDGPVKINSASLEELQSLPGIGPVLATRIQEERKRKSFTRIDDLRRVSGIGPKRIEQLRDLLVFD